MQMGEIMTILFNTDPNNLSCTVHSIAVGGSETTFSSGKQTCNGLVVSAHLAVLAGFLQRDTAL